MTHPQTDTEYRDIYLTYETGKAPSNVKIFDNTQYSSTLPDTVDWRSMNAVNPVKKQVTNIIMLFVCALQCCVFVFMDINRHHCMYSVIQTQILCSSIGIMW